MSLRRAFFHWLVPSAFLLPLWLLIGWGVFNASGWVFVWVLFIAIPSVFLGQLMLSFLVRARGTVRYTRAVSWWDVLGFTVWHALTIAVGFYDHAWFWPTLIAAIVAFVALFWLSLWQLLREAKPTAYLSHTMEGMAYIPAPAEASAPGAPQEVFIISEKKGPRTP